MATIRGFAAKGGAALAAIALVLSPAGAAKPAKKRVTASAASAFGGIGSFTPVAADPRTAALLSRGGLGGSGEFRFTPSAAKGSRRAVNVVVRARSVKPASVRQGPTSVAAATPEATTLQPIAYNLGVGIGWKRFAIAGEFAQVETNLIPGRRELADLGVSYSGKRWSTRLGISANRSIGNDTAIESEDSYAVDLGGSFSPAKNLELTGGLRYKSQREHLDVFNDDRRDSQSVYVGTAFRF